MKLTENHSRAQEMVDSWPAWKKEVSLTKYSTSVSAKAPVTNDGALKANFGDQEKQKVRA